MSYKTICCVGDSVANGYWCDRGLGWFGRLQETIAANYPKMFGFNNLAKSGDRTWDVYHRIASEVVTRQPDILLIAVGINDLIRWNSPDGTNDQSETSRAEAWNNVLTTAKANVGQVLVIGLLPNVEGRYPTTGWDDITPMWHRNSDTALYNTDIERWCQQADIPFLNIYDHWIQMDYEAYFEDGGHPNGRGHALLSTQVIEKLQQLGWVPPPKTPKKP
jgi:lysophospholipase L1-like esterase